MWLTSTILSSTLYSRRRKLWVDSRHRSSTFGRLMSTFLASTLRSSQCKWCRSFSGWVHNPLGCTRWAPYPHRPITFRA